VSSAHRARGRPPRRQHAGAIAVMQNARCTACTGRLRPRGVSGPPAR
jgi:hypothetical protein